MVRLLGEYLRDTCGVTCHQIVLGLRHQVIRRDAGTPVRLGEALVSLGFITENQLAFALEQQQYDLQVGVVEGLVEQAGSVPVVYLQ